MCLVYESHKLMKDIDFGKKSRQYYGIRSTENQKSMWQLDRDLFWQEDRNTKVQEDIYKLFEEPSSKWYHWHLIASDHKWAIYLWVTNKQTNKQTHRNITVYLVKS